MIPRRWRKLAPKEPPKKRPYETMSLGDAVFQLAADDPNLAPNTRKRWRYVANKFNRHLPGPLASLTIERLREYQLKRNAAGDRASTTLQEIDVASTLLRRIGREELCRHVRILKKPEPTIGKALSPEQKEKLLDACSSNQALHDLVSLGLLGLRSSEALNLQVGDYDHQQKLLTIQRSKTAAGRRRIPVPPELGERLARRAEASTAYGTTAMFPGRGPTAGQQRQGFWNAWKKARATAQLEEFRFHDLRHTFITELCERGAPDGVIRAIVGHVDEKMLALYSHVRIEAMRKAINAGVETAQATPAKQKEATPAKEEEEKP